MSPVTYTRLPTLFPHALSQLRVLHAQGLWFIHQSTIHILTPRAFQVFPGKKGGLSLVSSLTTVGSTMSFNSTSTSSEQLLYVPPVSTGPYFCAQT